MRLFYATFNIYNLFENLLLMLSFSKYDEYYLWLDSKYNVRRWDAFSSS